MSSGALVVGAGAAVGVMAADMSGQWSDQAALKAAADQVVEDPGNDDPIRRAVIVTRIKERHVTPKPVVVHRKVYVRAALRAGRDPRQGGPPAPDGPLGSQVTALPEGGRASSGAPKAPASAPKATSKTS